MGLEVCTDGRTVATIGIRTAEFRALKVELWEWIVSQESDGEGLLDREILKTVDVALASQERDP